MWGNVRSVGKGRGGRGLLDQWGKGGEEGFVRSVGKGRRGMGLLE